MHSDVIIVGGGPAGAACGIECAKNGLDVIILEKGEPYREKVCGDGISFDSQKALKSLGVFEEISKLAKESSKVVIYGGKGKRLSFDGPFFTLQRKVLDQILRDNCERKGGRVFYQSKVTDIEINEKEVRVRDSHQRLFDGGALVLATGADTNLAKRLGFEFKTPSLRAIRGYIPNKVNLNDYLGWVDKRVKGYFWAFPCPDGTINLGLGAYKGQSLKILLEDFVKTVPEITCGEDFIERPKIWPLRTGLRREKNYGNRVLLVGENVDCTYNLSGEGIGKALLSGMTAGKVLIDSKGNFTTPNLSVYDVLLGDSMKSVHDGYNLANKIAYGPLTDFYLSLFKRFPQTFDVFNEIAREEKDPKDLLTLRGIAKSLFLNR